MNFADLQVGSRIKQRSYDELWGFWSFGEDPGQTINTLERHVESFGYGHQICTVVKIKENENGYRYLVTLDPPLVSPRRKVFHIASCRWCEGAEEHELGGCGEVCWNGMLERVEE